MQTLAQDLRYALRTLHRYPGVTALAVLALGLGIGANTAVFTVLNGVLLRPLPFPHSDRLVIASWAPVKPPFRPMLGVGEEGYLEFRNAQPVFESHAMYGAGSVTLTGAGEAVRLPSASVTPEFFTVLDVHPAAGRDFFATDTATVILSDHLWRTRFRGESGVVGKVYNVDGVPHTVIGVMPAGMEYPQTAELWTPLAVKIPQGNSFLRPVIARLKPGQTLAQAEAAWTAFTKGLPPWRSKRNPAVPSVTPLKTLIVGDVRESLGVFAAAVAFVLLIACANVANLLLMRAESRRQEIAVRVAIGAGRWRLVRQLLTESTLVGVLGGAAGILLALWGVPALLALAPEGRIPRLGEVHIDRTVLVFTLGISILTGLLFGAAPAIQAARRTVRDALNLSVRVSGGSGLRHVLAVAEIALALVLLTGAGLMIKSLWLLHNVDPGFTAENLLTATVDLPDATYRQAAQMRAFHTQVLEKIAASHGVSAAGAVNSIPMTDFGFRGDVTLERGKFPPGFAIHKLVISPGFLHAMGVRLRSGRDLEASDVIDRRRVSVVSQSTARALWPGEDPIGQRFSESDKPKESDWWTVVGVVEDIRQSSLTRPPDPAIYYPYLQNTNGGWLSHMSYVVRTNSPQEAAAAMRGAIRAVDGDMPIGRMESMQDVIAATGAERRFQARLLSAFAALALAIAVIGIYGVIAYSVTLRTREIGIRMALGAKTGDVLTMVLRRTVALAAAGLAIGSLGAYFATRVLEKMLFQVTPHDPATMVAVAAALAAAALGAGWIPARRAARVDPLVALRWE